MLHNLQLLAQSVFELLSTAANVKQNLFKRHCQATTTTKTNRKSARTLFQQKNACADRGWVLNVFRLLKTSIRICQSVDVTARATKTLKLIDNVHEDSYNTISLSKSVCKHLNISSGISSSKLHLEFGSHLIIISSSSNLCRCT